MEKSINKKCKKDEILNYKQLRGKMDNMKKNDKAQKRTEENKRRSSNYRKNKETPDQAERRKKNDMIRSAEKRKRKKLTAEHIVHNMQAVLYKYNNNQRTKQKNASRMAYLRQNNNISKPLITEFDFEEDDQFPYIFKLVQNEEPTHRAFHHICWFTFCLFLYSEYHVTCCMIFCLCFCAFTFRRVLLCAYLCKSVQRSEKPETSVFLYSEMDDKY